MGTEEFFTWPVAKICYWKGRTHKPKTVATLMARFLLYAKPLTHKKAFVPSLKRMKGSFAGKSLVQSGSKS